MKTLEYYIYKFFFRGIGQLIIYREEQVELLLLPCLWNFFSGEGSRERVLGCCFFWGGVKIYWEGKFDVFAGG